MPTAAAVTSHASTTSMTSLALGLAALLGLSIPVAAQETIVQNDSIVVNSNPLSFGQPGFNFFPGDRAGARLVMPCDGRIVGVQVGWWGFSGSIITTQENAIRVHADGTFPVPGATLATIVSPTITSHPLLDPSINEYRTLDAAQTMPIDIPVLMDDAVYVVLEFGTATNVFVGGPSVVADVDGCTADSNVLFSVTNNVWVDGCPLIPGDLLFRVIIECDEPGACCLPDGTCQDILPNACATAGGTFEGEGTECAGVTCPVPSGACCIESTMGCLNLTEVDCATAAGTWQGGGTTCAGTDCFPPGACCLPSGGCIDSGDQFDCASLSGVFQGAGTTCGGVTCPQPCPADTDDSGDVDVIDLLSLLGQWGPCPPPCPEDLDGDGDVGVVDLLDLLGAWGPCP